MAHDFRRGLKTRNIIIIIIYPVELNVFFFFFSLRLLPLIRRHVDGSIVKHSRRVWRETSEEKGKKRRRRPATSVKICLTRRRDRCGARFVTPVCIWEEREKKINKKTSQHKVSR